MPLSYFIKTVIVKYLKNKKDLKMKRITTILAIGTTALFFTACGGGGGSSDTGGNTPAPPVETTPIPPDENAGLDPSGVTKYEDR